MTNPYKISFSQSKLTSVQKSLQKALLILLKNKKLEEIPVRMLCTKAQVARSSFYAHYENTDDILNEIEDQLVGKISDLDKNIIDPNRKSSSDFAYFSNIINFININDKILRTLLIKNYDHRLIEKWKKAIKAHLWERLKLVNTTIKQDLIFEMVSTEVISAFIYYLNHPNTIREDDIYQIIATELQNLNQIGHFS